MCVCVCVWYTQYVIDAHSGRINPTMHREYFSFFGRLLGKAITDSILVDVPLCTAMFGAMTSRDQPTLEELGEVDSAMESSMEWILDHDITVQSHVLRRVRVRGFVGRVCLRGKGRQGRQGACASCSS